MQIPPPRLHGVQKSGKSRMRKPRMIKPRMMEEGELE
jgi:hypothetical protein